MSHKNLFVFDIETVPDTDVAPALTGTQESTVQARRQALTDYHLSITDGKNSFLRQPFHRVVAISFLEAEIAREGAQEVYLLRDVRSGGNEKSGERDLIQGFFQYLKSHRPRLVSFNGRGFDMAVLKYRAMKYGIGADFLYHDGDKWNNYTARYSHDWHCDLMDVLSDYGSSAKVRLNEVCAALGLPGKIGVDGGDVATLYDEGRITEIRQYCESDVLNTYLVYLRLMLHRGTIATEGYNRAVADLVTFIKGAHEDRPALGAFMDAWGEACDYEFMLK